MDELPTLRDVLIRHKKQQSFQSDDAIKQRQKVVSDLGDELSEL